MPPEQTLPSADEQDVEPAVFLKSLRELSEKRDREDAERFRKLEEEVEQSRRERAARRAERARSISPDKPLAIAPTSLNFNNRVIPRSILDDNTPTLRPSSNLSSNLSEPAPVHDLASSDTSMNAKSTDEHRSSTEAVPDFKGFAAVKRASGTTSNSIAKASGSAPSPAANTTTSATSLARSGTLSWQQRPGSRASVQKTVPSESSSTHDNVLPHKTEEPEPSREQIAAALGTRDPSWFRQTADRGAGSAAYRKSKDEDYSGDRSSALKRELPGLSRESSIDPESGNSPQLSESLSNGGSTRESFLSTPTRYSASSLTNNKPDLKSPDLKSPDLKSLILADEGQQRASPAFEQAPSTESASNRSSRIFAMSSSQARLANGADRPMTPTRGTGGFVQSAMLKRSDSVSKRSSSQSPTRQNSVLSNRGGYEAIVNQREVPKLYPTQGSATVTNDVFPSGGTILEEKSSDKPATSKVPTDSSARSTHRHTRSKSVASTFSMNEDGVIQSPGSPSKRWSPNKSSWIESALTRPDSPSKPAPSKNAQPSWMADLAKANAKRASVDVAQDPVLKNALDLRPKPELMTSRSTAQTPPVAEKYSSSTTRPDATDSFASSASSVTPRPLQSKVNVGSTKPAPLFQDKPKSPLPKPQKMENSSAFASDTPPALSIKRAETSPAMLTSSPAFKPLERASNATTPITDFRSALKSRAPVEAQSKAEPEFLAKFGNLRRTQQEKYVAPDELKSNILRGKSGLSVTGGPVKSVIKDELKESLLAKKEDIKKAKDEGRELPGEVHQKKTDILPKVVPKPEALAKRELLGRTDSTRTTQSAAPVVEAAPEALVRHKSLKKKPAVEETKPSMESVSVADVAMGSLALLSKQASAPAAIETRRAPETSKLAARFNPGLAGMLARGPPSGSASRPESAASGVQTLSPASNSVGEPTSDQTLTDVRKDRAKGPKRRKAGEKNASGNTEVAPATKPASVPALNVVSTQQDDAAVVTSPPPVTPNSAVRKNFSAPFRRDGAGASSEEQSDAQPVASKPKPQALPGSAASVMAMSLKKSSEVEPLTSPTQASQPASKPSPRANFSKPIAMSQNSSLSRSQPASETAPAPVLSSVDPVPEFKGFAGRKTASDESRSPLPQSPSADQKPAWMRQPPVQRGGASSQVQANTPKKISQENLPRSSSLQAQHGATGLGISVGDASPKLGATATSNNFPAKPAKSSRIVSGQLVEDPFKPVSPVVALSKQPRIKTEASRFLLRAFGTVIKSQDSLSIDTQATLSCAEKFEDEGRTTKTVIEAVRSNGTTDLVPVREEYTLFDETVYLCTNHFTSAKGINSIRFFVWAGSRSRESTVDAAKTLAQKASRVYALAPVSTIRQGQETSAFLTALGGILITRRGARDKARKQYMLCGRKQLGHIVFDEVDFGVNSLQPGYIYIISSGSRMEDPKVYIWKGSACSTDELSAARLAAMDLTPTGGIEVENSYEQQNISKVFGPRTTIANFPRSNELWKHKAMAPNKFVTRLFRFQHIPAKPPGLISSFLGRRPSLSPMNTGKPEPIKATATPLQAIIQSVLEPEGIYLLDASYKLYLLIGPLFASMQPVTTRDALFAQALLFASEYAILAAGLEDRVSIPKCVVVFAGVPLDVKILFRQWDEGLGLWGTGGLMAGLGKGSPGGKEVAIPLEEVVNEVFRS